MSTSCRVFCYGVEGLKLYAEIHQNTANQLIHGLFMPLVGYAFMGGFPILISLLRREQLVSRDRLLLRMVFIFCLYALYYATFDMPGTLATVAIYYWVLPFITYKYSSVMKIGLDSVRIVEYQHFPNLFTHFVGALCIAIFIQEGIGHRFGEEIHSDLWQLPNSISIAPLFGTRALMHNFFGWPLVPE